jgi:hypothetical protein
MVIPDDIKQAQRNLVAFHATFIGGAVIGAGLQATGCRHGYITGLLVVGISVVFCTTFPISDRKISTTSIIIVAVYTIAVIMFLTAEFGELEQLPQIDQAALAERMRKMAAKPAFVASNGTLGTFTIVAAAIMIFSYDSYLGVSMMIVNLFGIDLNVLATYNSLHAKLGIGGLPSSSTVQKQSASSN